MDTLPAIPDPVGNLETAMGSLPLPADATVDDLLAGTVYAIRLGAVTDELRRWVAEVICVQTEPDTAERLALIEQLAEQAGTTSRTLYRWVAQNTKSASDQPLTHVNEIRPPTVKALQKQIQALSADLATARERIAVLEAQLASRPARTTRTAAAVASACSKGPRHVATVKGRTMPTCACGAQKRPDGTWIA